MSCGHWQLGKDLRQKGKLGAFGGEGGGEGEEGGETASTLMHLLLGPLDLPLLLVHNQQLLGYGLLDSYLHLAETHTK